MRSTPQMHPIRPCIIEWRHDDTKSFACLRNCGCLAERSRLWNHDIYPLGLACTSCQHTNADGYNPSYSIHLHNCLLFFMPVSYTHLRAHETPEHLVCRL